MPANLPLLDRIEQSSSKEREYKTLTARFGNGYSQGIPDGINNVMDTWSLSYTQLTQAERDTLMAALNSVAGWDYLMWQPFGEATVKRWKIMGKVKEDTTGLLYNIMFTLEQTY